MTSEDDWNSASDHFVDALVSHLKTTRRWSRDGRKLRLLNKHWCAVLTRHVTEIHPHYSRTLDFRDVDSLLKFSSVTEVDTTVFEQQTEGAQALCLRLAETLLRLPRLRRLKVSKFLELFDMESIYHLSGITSLRCKDFTENCLNKISRLPLKELSGSFTLNELVRSIPKMASLKTLEIEGSMYSIHWDIADLVDCTKGVDSVRLLDVGGSRIEHLTRMTNLTSVHVEYNTNPDDFSHFTRLTSLTWRLNSVEGLRSASFKHLVERLHELWLIFGVSMDDYCQMPSGIMSEARKLESLGLEHFLLTQGLIDELSNGRLTSLDLNMCKTMMPLRFNDAFTSLKTLSLFTDDLRFSDLGLDLSTLSQLTRLDMHSLDCLSSMVLRNQIRCLTRLESLTLMEADGKIVCRSFEFFKAIEDLPRLASLDIHASMSSNVMEAFFRLKALTDLEDLNVMSRSETDLNVRRLKWLAGSLKEKALYLRLSINAGHHTIIRC